MTKFDESRIMQGECIFFDEWLMRLNSINFGVDGAAITWADIWTEIQQ